MQATHTADRALIRKLESSLGATIAPSALRDRCHQQKLALEQQRTDLLTAQAKARASEDVARKFEREIFLLRAALAVKAEEFNVNPPGGEPSGGRLGGHGTEGNRGGVQVHSHLIMALAQARDVGADLAAQLADSRAGCARVQDELAAARAEVNGLRGKKDVAESAVLQLQASLVDATDVAQQLHAETLEQQRSLHGLRTASEVRVTYTAVTV